MMMEDLNTTKRKFNISTQNFSIWDDPKIWEIEHEKKYPKKLLHEFENLKEQIIDFVSSDYSHKVSNKYNRNYKFMKNLAYYITKFENFVEAFIQTNGYYGEYGLLLAKAKIDILLEKYTNQVETITYQIVEQNYSGITYAVKNGFWEEFGIKKGSWNDFLKYTMGTVNRKESNYYKGYGGLQRAIEEVKKLDQNLEANGKNLTSADIDKHYKGILGAIGNGYWTNFGVRKGSWNDFMMITLGRVNQEQKPNGYYIGEEGLKNAANEVKNLDKKLKRENKALSQIDVKKIYPGIIHAIGNSYWEEFGIRQYSWNDFMQYALGRINEISHDPMELEKTIKSTISDFREKKRKITAKAILKELQMCKKTLYKYNLSEIIKQAIVDDLIECRYSYYHDGLHPHKCIECEYEHKHSGKIRRHYRTHSKEKPFQCEICKSNFSTKYELKSHTRRHTGEKPYKCNQCKWEFPTSSELSRHKKTHTDEKPFKCKPCNYGTSSSSNFKRHSQTKKHETNLS